MRFIDKKKLIVGFKVFEFVGQELGGAQIFHIVQQLAQNPHPLHFVFLHQQVFTASAGATDIDGGVDALLGDLAIQVQFLVAGALKLFVDDFIHFRAGVHQGGGDNTQAATFLDITGGTEEALGALQGVGVDTTGQTLPEEGTMVL